jgi:hypothetical protein
MKNVGGWEGYIDHHARTGPISDREHAAFLNMWFKKFIFSRKTVGPTTNMQAIVKSLVTGHLIPLGKHLLGLVFSVLQQISIRLSAGQPIRNLGGPWWFINIWLNLYMHKVLGHKLHKMSFPSNHTEEEKPRTRRCMSYGEAAWTFPCDRLALSEVATFFRCFYNGFT